MLISVLVRCGLTMRYTRKPAIASVARTAKNTNARTADSNLMYQRIGRAWVCSSAKVTMKFGRPHEISEKREYQRGNLHASTQIIGANLQVGGVCSMCTVQFVRRGGNVSAIRMDTRS